MKLLRFVNLRLLTLVVLIFVCSTANNAVLALQEKVDGLTRIGVGVHLFNQRKSPKELLKRDIDFKTAQIGENKVRIPEYLEYSPDRGKGSKTKKDIASSFRELQTRLNVAAAASGEYGGFSGSVQSKFSTEARTATKSYVAQIVHSEPVGKLEFKDSNLGTLEQRLAFRKILEPSFLLDLNNPAIKPGNLFEKWGTHLVTKINLGGNVYFFMSSKNSQNTTRESFELAIEAKYDGVFKAEANANLSSEVKRAIQQHNLSIEHEVVGGESFKFSEKSRENAEWKASVLRRPAYTGRPRDSLLGIWEFCIDEKGRINESRKKEILDEFNRQRALFKLQNLIIISEYFKKNTGGDVPSNTATLEVPRGYKILSGGAEVTNGYHLFLESYPYSTDKWRAKSVYHIEPGPSSPTGDKNAGLTISVIAIHDPEEEDDWEVKIDSQKFKKNNSGNHDDKLKELDNYLLTGGGVKSEPAGGWAHVLVGSNPVKEGGKFYWRAETQQHLYEGRAQNTLYTINLRARSELGIDLDRRLFSEPGDPGQGSTGEARIRDAGFVLVGGGVAGQRDVAFPYRSLPKYSGKDKLWYGYTSQYWKESYGSVTAYAIGLKPTRK